MVWVPIFVTSQVWKTCVRSGMLHVTPVSHKIYGDTNKLVSHTASHAVTLYGTWERSMWAMRFMPHSVYLAAVKSVV